MKSYKEIVEALKGKQHKIDKNKNGKIDAHDFKLLRKEETELTEATVKTQKYSWGTMKTVHHGADFSIPLHPEHHQAIAKLKDEQEHKFKTEDGKHWTARRKGEDVHFHSGNDGPKTMVKHSALKEETIEEKKVPEPTGKLKDACWKGYTAVGMKMKDGRKVPNCVPVKEEKDEEDRVVRSDYKLSPSGRKSHKEIVFKHGESDKKDLQEKAPPGFEGTVKAMKKHKDIDNPYALAWSMYKKGYKSHKKEDGTMKEEIEIEEQAPVAPVPGDKWKSHAVMVNGKQRVVIKRSNVKNYPEHEGWKEVSPGQKIKENDDVKFSYTELMMMLEYEPKDGVYRHKGTYGSEYAKKEREKDEKGFDAEDKPTNNLTKRGRGRPAGSKSGARGPRIK